MWITSSQQKAVFAVTFDILLGSPLVVWYPALPAPKQSKQLEVLSKYSLAMLASSQREPRPRRCSDLRDLTPYASSAGWT